MPNRRGICPTDDSVEEHFPFVFGELFRIPNLVDPGILGNGYSADGEWSRPRSLSDLIEPDDDI